MGAPGGSSGPSGASGGNSGGGVGGGTDGNGREKNENLPTINKPPTDIILSKQIIKEKRRKGSRIGEFSAEDSDSRAPFTYKLVSGEGGGDNDAFKIVGDVLIADRVFDYERDNSYSIRVAVTDSSGKTYQKRFTIRVKDIKGDNIRAFDSDSKMRTSFFLDNLTSTLTRKDSIGFVKNGVRDRNDYFSFNLVQSGSLTVNLKKLKADADFQIFDALGNLVGQSQTNGRKADFWTSGLLNAGIYTIRVLPDKGARTRYTLSLSTTPAPVTPTEKKNTETGTKGQPIPIDPNGSFDAGAANFDLGVIPVYDATIPINLLATSPLVQPGEIGFTETYGDDVNDYLKFTLSSRSSVAVSISGLTADADLELFDSNMTSLGKSANPGTQPDALLGYDFAPGTYYARVTPYGNAQTKYNLSLIADTPYEGFGSILYSDQYLGTLNTQHTSDDNSNLLKTSSTVYGNSDEFYGFRVGSFTDNDIYVTLFTLYDDASLQIYNSAFKELYYTNVADYSYYYGEYYETINLSSLRNYDGLKAGELYYARVVASGSDSAAFGLNVSDNSLV